MATTNNPFGVCNSKYRVDKVIIDKGDFGWCLAKAYKYEDKKSHYVSRWNGGLRNDGTIDLGFPNGNGYPTWYQEPDDLNEIFENLEKMAELVK